MKAKKAAKTAVGAGMNWKLTMKLTFIVLRICQTIRKKMSEAARLKIEEAWEDHSCLNLKRRLVDERDGTETAESDVKVTAMVNFLQSNQKEGRLRISKSDRGLECLEINHGST